MITKSRFSRVCGWTAIFLIVGFGACSKPEPPAAGERPAQAVEESTGKNSLILSAGASTKEAMEALAEQFKADTGTEVKVNLGSSSALAAQILAGAPADLFLSANQQWADEVSKAGHADASVRLLTNSLVIVAPTGNPGDVHKPEDLLSDKVKKIALAGEKVPAGIYADQTLKKLGLLQKLTDANKIVRGQDVRSALSYVVRGEAEAGFVYSTDVSSAPGVSIASEIDPKLHDEIVYVLVLLKHDGENAAAKKLFDFLQSPAADTVYTKFGFSRLTTNGKTP
jgi:molybdate transport system substrate-binding protein